MVLRRIYKSVTRPFHKTRPQKTSKKLKKHKKYQADKPPVDGRCLLLELPAEIRLRILEFTLCGDEPIQARQNLVSNYSYHSPYYDYKHLVEYDEWSQGKPCLGLLSTCRQLYEEGSEIFYNKNTFAITICDPGFGVYGHIDMLGMGEPQTVFTTNPRFSKCPNLKFHLYLGRTVNCDGLSYGTNKDSIDEAIEQVYQTWQGRGRLEIEVSQPGKLWVDHPVGAPALLHKFGLFRCKSVWFRGVPYSIAYRMTSLIESDAPIIDLQQALRDLAMFVEKTYIRDDSYESTHTEAYTKAERFAAMFDVENFMLARKEVVEAALQQMKASFNRTQDRGSTLQSEALPTRTAGERTDSHQALMALLNYM